MNYQEQLQEIKTNPIEFAKKKGFTIPEELASNPQAMIYHLINSGQVGGQAMQRIMPMIQQMMGK